MEITIGNMTDQRQAATDFLSASPRVGLEADNVSWSVSASGPTCWTRPSWCPTSNAVEALREVKDEAEIARMERAAAIADAALYEVLPLLSEDVTEEQFALELDTAMRRGGAESMAFETIVAAGRELGHAPPPARARAGSARAIPSSSTSAPPTRATART